MMRTPSNWAVAVRKPDGEIAQVGRVITSPMAKRGSTACRSSAASSPSASRSPSASARSRSRRTTRRRQEEGEEDFELSRGQIIFAFAIAIGFALALFKVGPALITSRLDIDTTQCFVVVEGLIRVGIFILYLVLISLLPDLRRLFQYHAAEHKAINAYEAGEELTPERVDRFSLIHPRCGTAFLLWVMVIAIFVFAFFGQPAWYWLIASRILMLPVIAGPRVRAHPLRRQAPGESRRDGAARARSLAAAADDAHAVARPDRGLDPGARGGPGAGRWDHEGGEQSGGDGVGEEGLLTEPHA